MKRLKLTKARQERFLTSLAKTGNVTAAVATAGTSRTHVYELRKADPGFAARWEEAEEIAVDALEAGAGGVPSKACKNRSSAPESSFEMMTVNRSQSGATRITCFWHCSRRTARRGANGRCVSNCRHFDPPLMQRAQWRRLPPGLRLAK